MGRETRADYSHMLDAKPRVSYAIRTKRHQPPARLAAGHCLCFSLEDIPNGSNTESLDAVLTRWGSEYLSTESVTAGCGWDERKVNDDHRGKDTNGSARARQLPQR
jgi:hypothetical protein